MNWHEYFFALCDTVASKSKDPSTKVGCVIVDDEHFVLSTGYNGFPVGVQDIDERYQDRPVKYAFIVHAEANAISHAARHGVTLNGATIYTPWHPCNECAKLIIQSGIKTVITKQMDDDKKSRWEKHCAIANVMLTEAGINVKYI